MPVRRALLPHFSVGPVVVDPIEAEPAVELGAEARREEEVAEQTAGGVQDEYLELRLRDREAVRACKLGQHPDDEIDVLDVVDDTAVRMSEAVVDRRAVVVPLRARDLLRGVAVVLPVYVAENADEPAFAGELVRRARITLEPVIDEVV